MFIRIANDGPEIRSTNYWHTPHAQAGAIYLSQNAGTFRLLVPDPSGILGGLRDAIDSTEFVVVSRGTARTAFGTHDMLEFLFEDHSECPFSVHITTQMCDAVPTAADSGRTDLRCIVYGPGNEVIGDLPARYRVAPSIPCLKPWKSM